MSAYPAQSNRLRAFSLTEILVVMAVIAVLIAVLLPALTGAKRTADAAKSMNHMKQIATWMSSYASENRDYVVPSQFDYTQSAANGYPVKVRSDDDLATSDWGDLQYKGTWTDILWVYAGLGVKSQLLSDDTYFYDSPDEAAHEADETYEENPLRAGAPNTRDFYVAGVAGNGPKPFGNGATEAGLPGFFAANNFFNTNPAGSTSQNWFTSGQIKAPSRSMYLVDSFAGETIEPDPVPFDNTQPASGEPTIEVDFRYKGNCLMMFMDGHVATQSPWGDICDIEQIRPVRIRNLTSNTNPCP